MATEFRPLQLDILQSHLRSYLGPQFVLRSPTDEQALAVWNHAVRSYRELLDAKLCAERFDFGSHFKGLVGEAHEALAVVIRDCQ